MARKLSDLHTADEMAYKDTIPFESNCSACNEHLQTEGDFYRHFTVINSIYRNLGECPNKTAK